MGMFRARRHNRRSQRDHGSSTSAVTADQKEGTTTASKKWIGKLLVYILVIGFLQFRKKKASTTNDSSSNNNKPMTPVIISRFDNVCVVNNVLPYQIALQFSNRLQKEWFRAQNGEWQYCSSEEHCHKDNVRVRNETIHATSNKQQSKWILTSENHILKSFLKELTSSTNTVLMTNVLQQIIQHDSNNDDEQQRNVIINTVTPTNLIASHFTTADFQKNIISTTTATDTTTPNDTNNMIIISFHIILLQQVAMLEEDPQNFTTTTTPTSQIKKSTTDGSTADDAIVWRDNYGGVIQSGSNQCATTSTTSTNTNSHEESCISTHDTAPSASASGRIVPQFNTALFWKKYTSLSSTLAGSSSTAATAPWTLSPVSWVAEENNTRLFIVSGDFLVSTTTSATTTSKQKN